MGLFNYQAKKDKKLKLQLIKKIQEIDNVVLDTKLFGISNNLSKIIDMLDNPHISIESSKVGLINNELDSIRKYSIKGYEEYLKSKCESIIAILKKNELREPNNRFNSNNDHLYKILGEQTKITNKINELTNKMDSALGKDKNMWLMLNMQKNSLSNKLSILSKNYSTLLTAQSNLQFVDEIQKAKKEAEMVVENQQSIDVADVEIDMNYITQANDETLDTYEKINDSFAKSFGLNNDDFSYEKALEKKMLEESNCGDVFVDNIGGNKSVV